MLITKEANAVTGSMSYTINTYIHSFSLGFFTELFTRQKSGFLVLYYFYLIISFFLGLFFSFSNIYFQGLELNDQSTHSAVINRNYLVNPIISQNLYQGKCFQSLSHRRMQLIKERFSGGRFARRACFQAVRMAFDRKEKEAPPGNRTILLLTDLFRGQQGATVSVREYPLLNDQERRTDLSSMSRSESVLYLCPCTPLAAQRRRATTQKYYCLNELSDWKGPELHCFILNGVRDFNLTDGTKEIIDQLMDQLEKDRDYTT